MEDKPKRRAHNGRPMTCVSINRVNGLFGETIHEDWRFDLREPWEPAGRGAFVEVRGADDPEPLHDQSALVCLLDKKVGVEMALSLWAAEVEAEIAKDQRGDPEARAAAFVLSRATEALRAADGGEPLPQEPAWFVWYRDPRLS